MLPRPRLGGDREAIAVPVEQRALEGAPKRLQSMYALCCPARTHLALAHSVAHAVPLVPVRWVSGGPASALLSTRAFVSLASRFRPRAGPPGVSRPAPPRAASPHQGKVSGGRTSKCRTGTTEGRSPHKQLLSNSSSPKQAAQSACSCPGACRSGRAPPSPSSRSPRPNRLWSDHAERDDERMRRIPQKP